MAIADVAKAVRDLTSQQIRQRIEELEQEMQGLKIMLRSACARERAQRKREAANGTR